MRCFLPWHSGSRQPSSHTSLKTTHVQILSILATSTAPSLSIVRFNNSFMWQLWRTTWHSHPDMWLSLLQSSRAETKSTWRLTSPTLPKSPPGSLAQTCLSVSKFIKTVFLESILVTQARSERFPASESQTSALVSSGVNSSRKTWMEETTTWPLQLMVSSSPNNRLLDKTHSKFQSNSTHLEFLNRQMERTSLKLTIKTRFSTNPAQLKLISQSRWAST